MTRKDFSKQFDAAKPGTWIAYYYGYLWADRTKSKELNALAREVWQRYVDGKATLVQKRLGTDCFYYVVKL